ncbi:hypothetical protein N5K21_22365 [Rhizobium pusense]|uniref:Uncharacterized protein n=1 Tax=Agrobacterium pusense TaxID=648995 RepID=A0A6H0ZPR7_9HYPH|nr:hypothetical protein [Agrobacterium pusense]MDH2091479.1 hypothetical protein [Agrobacterium pusense]QIX22619.1 hypothetical protein FOB41_16460 [Agrobacterium pusense]WCK24530.1 hypothetical protein CFBP5496_0002760 [Agrobacterium pusense]
MPVLKFTNDEIGTLLHALPSEAGEWLRCKTLHGSAQNFNSVSRILENVIALEARVQDVCDNITDEDDEEPIHMQITEAEAKRRTAVAKMIIAEIDAAELAASGNTPIGNAPAPRAGSGWHHQHGWLHPKKAMEAAAAAVEAGETTREEAADALGVDLAEVDAENARDRARLRAFWTCALAEPWTDIEDLDGGEDQMSPGTWTTLPEDCEGDDEMFDVTDPEPTTAGIDTQSTPDCKVSISITVGGKTLTIDGHEDVLETIREFNRAADAA